MQTLSTITSLMYGVGYVLEELQLPSGKGGAASLPRPDIHPDIDEEDWIDEEPLDYGAYAEEDQPGDGAAPTNGAPDAVVIREILGPLATGWLISKVLRPRPVSWPRALAAGLAAATLAALADQLQDALRPGSIDYTEPPQPSTRYITGIATASAYASLFYSRLPGSPVMRGLMFGGLEALMAPGGGAAAAVRQISPRFSFPMAALVGPVADSVLGHLAYGVGLGLVYREPLHEDDA
jgi:hypothetical protein